MFGTAWGRSVPGPENKGPAATLGGGGQHKHSNQQKRSGKKNHTNTATNLFFKNLKKLFAMAYSKSLWLVRNASVLGSRKHFVTNVF